MLLGVVAGAARGYLAERALPPQPLVAQVPAMIPTPDEAPKNWGNHILGFPTSLATDVADPWARLQAISEKTTEAKKRLQLLDPPLLWECLDVIPPVLQRAATDMQYRQRKKDPTRVETNLLVSHFRDPRPIGDWVRPTSSRTTGSANPTRGWA